MNQSTYTYFPDGTQETQLYQNWQGEQWVDYYKYTSLRDEKGNEIQYKREVWQNSALTAQSFKWDYSYRDVGGYRSISFNNFQNGQWTPYNTTISFTDSSSNTYSFSQCYQVDMAYQSEVNVPEIDEIISLDLAPNPATDFIDVRLTDVMASKPARIEVFDAQGRLLIITPVTSQVNTRIDISSLAPGAYILKFDGKSKSFIKE
jgi:hypothetical protein